MARVGSAQRRRVVSAVSALGRLRLVGHLRMPTFAATSAIRGGVSLRSATSGHDLAQITERFCPRAPIGIAVWRGRGPPQFFG